MPHRDLVDPLERGDIGRLRCFPRQERLEIRTLADWRIRPVRSYTHADREVYAQLSARERVVAGLLLTEGRAS